MPPRKGTKKASTPAVVVEVAIPDSPLTTADKAVNQLIDSLDVLFEPNEQVASSMTNTVKVLYDYLKQNEGKDVVVDSALPELLVEGFDSEQIWEQLKLQMDPMIENTETFVTTFVLDEMKEDDNEEEEDDEDGLLFGDDDEDEESMDYLMEEEEQKSDKKVVTINSNKTKAKKLVVPKELKHIQDKFFDFEDMHRFADEGEFEDDETAKQELRSLRRRRLIEAGELEEDDEIDQVGDNDDEEEGNADDDVDVFADVQVSSKDKFMYSDFFLPPNEDEEEENIEAMLDSWEGDIQGLEGDDHDLDLGLFDEQMQYEGEEGDEYLDMKQQLLLDDEEEDTSKYMQIEDSDHVADHLLSTYQKRQQKMGDQIKAIEQQLLGPKRWDMTGESKSHTRELDVLLDADLDFEFATKAAMPITEEVAEEIEQIIRNRIKDGAFDDVQPKFVAPEKMYEPKEEVSSEKSKYGLAEIYEKEYLQMAQGTASDAQMKLNDQHQQITELFTDLCHKLDALSNFFYAPKSKNMEMQVVSTSNAINMEELLPMAVNDTIRAAPQEVFQAASRGLVASREEQDKEEKDAHRRNKKDKKRKHFEIEESKLQQNAAAGDEKSKKLVDQKDMAKRYKEATGTKQVVQMGSTDSTKYSTSAQFFQKLQDTVGREKSGIKAKPKTKLLEQGNKASKYMS